jgi:hypothetical protein
MFASPNRRKEVIELINVGLLFALQQIDENTAFRMLVCWACRKNIPLQDNQHVFNGIEIQCDYIKFFVPSKPSFYQLTPFHAPAKWRPAPTSGRGLSRKLPPACEPTGYIFDWCDKHDEPCDELYIHDGDMKYGCKYCLSEYYEDYMR